MATLVKYSNGYGHLIMSIFFGVLAAAFILWPTGNQVTQGIGYALIGTVSSAWFIPSAAKQVAHEVTQNMQSGGANNATNNTTNA